MALLNNFDFKYLKMRDNNSLRNYTHNPSKINLDGQIVRINYYGQGGEYVGLPAVGHVTLLVVPPFLQVAVTAEAPTAIVEEVVNIAEEIRHPCVQVPV